MGAVSEINFLGKKHLMGLIRVQKKKSNAMLPVKTHGAALGHEIHTLYQTRLCRGQTALATTGLVLEQRSDRIAFILGKMPSKENGCLEVEQDFVETGRELQFVVRNASNDGSEISPYTCLSRMVLLKCSGGAPNIVESLDVTERGEKGYGSTGLK